MRSSAAAAAEGAAAAAQLRILCALICACVSIRPACAVVFSGAGLDDTNPFALALNGGFVTIPSGSGPPTSDGPFSIDFWVRSAGSSALGGIYSRGEEFKVSTAGGVLHLARGSGSVSTLLPVLIADKFVHVAVVVDPSGNCRVLANGVQVALNNAVLPATAPAWENETYIGASPGGNDPFIGALDEFRVWSRALSTQEVSLFVSGTTPDEILYDPSLLLYHSFDEDESNVSPVARDSSRYGRHGTLSDSTLVSVAREAQSPVPDRTSVLACPRYSLPLYAPSAAAIQCTFSPRSSGRALRARVAFLRAAVLASSTATGTVTLDPPAAGSSAGSFDVKVQLSGTSPNGILVVSVLVPSGEAGAPFELQAISELPDGTSHIDWQTFWDSSPQRAVINGERIYGTLTPRKNGIQMNIPRSSVGVSPDVQPWVSSFGWWPEPTTDAIWYRPSAAAPLASWFPFYFTFTGVPTDNSRWDTFCRHQEFGISVSVLVGALTSSVSVGRSFFHVCSGLVDYAYYHAISPESIHWRAFRYLSLWEIPMLWLERLNTGVRTGQRTVYKIVYVDPDLLRMYTVTDAGYKSEEGVGEALGEGASCSAAAAGRVPLPLYGRL
eukprot:tig00020902_g14974.t1